MIRMSIEIEGLDHDFANTSRKFEDIMFRACQYLSGQGLFFRAELVTERVAIYEGE